MGPDQGHGPHLARPGRLRPVLVGLAPQLLHRPHRHRYVRHDAIHLGLPGEGHRLRRRQEAGEDHRRNPGAVSAEQGHHDPVRVPDRSDRRRHRSGVEEEVQGIRRQDHRAGALRGLSRRLAVARSPHRQRRGARLGVRQDRPVEEPLRTVTVRRGDHRRLQHRRRRLVEPHPARGDGTARDRPVVGRRHHRRTREHAEGQAERPPLLPLDELHLAPHGREVRRFPGSSTTSSVRRRSKPRCARSPATSTTRSRKAPSR